MGISIAAMSSYIRRHHRALDYEALIHPGHRVVLVGEHHPFRGVKQELVRALPTLQRRCGITDIGLEMLPSSSQRLLDRFSFHKDRAGRDALLHRLSTYWETTPHEYLSVIDRAAELGLRIHALGEPRRPRVQHSALNPAGQIGFSADRYMARQMLAALHTQEYSKWLVLAGLEHAERRGQRLARVLAVTHGLPVLNLRFFGRQGGALYHLVQALTQAGLSTKKVAFDMSGLVGYPTYFDWYVYLPSGNGSRSRRR